MLVAWTTFCVRNVPKLFGSLSRRRCCWTWTMNFVIYSYQTRFCYSTIIVIYLTQAAYESLYFYIEDSSDWMGFFSVVGIIDIAAFSCRHHYICAPSETTSLMCATLVWHLRDRTSLSSVSMSVPFLVAITKRRLVKLHHTEHVWK